MLRMHRNSVVFWLALAVAGSACSRSKNKGTDTETTTTESAPTMADEADSSVVSIAQSAKSLATKTVSHSDVLYFAPFPFTDTLYLVHQRM
ncbi:MAG: hypothetical protein FJ146_19560 [Deltaproteobacteria bacterium]|nr:hypothetical protein [Deltaproteobacteria bacterium]